MGSNWDTHWYSSCMCFQHVLSCWISPKRRNILLRVEVGSPKLLSVLPNLLLLRPLAHPAGTFFWEELQIWQIRRCSELPGRLCFLVAIALSIELIVSKNLDLRVAFFTIQYLEILCNVPPCQLQWSYFYCVCGGGRSLRSFCLGLWDLPSNPKWNSIHCFRQELWACMYISFPGMSALIDAESGHLSRTIQNQEEFVIKFLAPMWFVLELKTWHFVPSPLLSAYFHTCLLLPLHFRRFFEKRWSYVGCSAWKVAFVTVHGLGKTLPQGDLHEGRARDGDGLTSSSWLWSEIGKYITGEGGSSFVSLSFPRKRDFCGNTRWGQS